MGQAGGRNVSNVRKGEIDLESGHSRDAPQVKGLAVALPGWDGGSWDMPDLGCVRFGALLDSRLLDLDSLVFGCVRFWELRCVGFGTYWVLGRVALLYLGWGWVSATISIIYQIN